MSDAVNDLPVVATSAVEFAPHPKRGGRSARVCRRRSDTTAPSAMRTGRWEERAYAPTGFLRPASEI
jgi:hypothetical protein